MSKKPSIETELRNVKRELKEVKSWYSSEKGQRLRLEVALSNMEIERNEWRARFDKLLERITPMVDVEGRVPHPTDP